MENIVQNLALLHPAIATAVGVVGAVITCASTIANFFPKATKFGKIVHFLAVNWSAKTGT